MLWSLEALSNYNFIYSTKYGFFLANYPVCSLPLVVAIPGRSAFVIKRGSCALTKRNSVRDAKRRVRSPAVSRGWRYACSGRKFFSQRVSTAKLLIPTIVGPN